MDVSHIKTWRERVAHLDKPTDFAERWAAIDEANELRRFIAALPSDAAQAPVCWITKEQLDQIEDLTADAWVYWRETGHAAEDDEVPLYAAPVAADAAAREHDDPQIIAAANKAYAAGLADGKALGELAAEPTTLWVLTRGINEYNQDGEYFVAAFAQKPTAEQLAEHVNLYGWWWEPDCKPIDVLLETGGDRQKTEDQWFILREVSQ